MNQAKVEDVLLTAIKVVVNAISLAFFTFLAIYFHEWWIVLLSFLFREKLRKGEI